MRTAATITQNASAAYFEGVTGQTVAEAQEIEEQAREAADKRHKLEKVVKGAANNRADILEMIERQSAGDTVLAGGRLLFEVRDTAPGRLIFFDYGVKVTAAPAGFDQRWRVTAYTKDGRISWEAYTVPLPTISSVAGRWI